MDKASADEEAEALRNVCGPELCGCPRDSYAKVRPKADRKAFSQLLFKHPRRRFNDGQVSRSQVGVSNPVPASGNFQHPWGI